MFKDNTVKKVIIWRLLSITTASLLTMPFFTTFSVALGVTLYINVVMTIIHYFFEKAWEKRFKPDSKPLS